MKQFFLPVLSLLLLTAAPAVAQLSGNVEYNLWRVQPGDSMTIFSDKAYIRQSASLQSPIMDSLTSGSSVIAVKLNETELTLRGMTTPWWQVRYKAGGKQKEGYLWLGLAALGTYRQDTVQLVYGIEKVIPGATKEDDPKYQVGLKALGASHHLLDKKEQVVAGGQFSISAEGKLLGNMGLDKLSTILRLCFSGEACGIPSDYYYFGWNGSKFLILPQKSTIFDAGAIAHDEVLLFPKEPGGQPGKIIKVITDEEFGEDGETVVKKTTDREVFVWDGENAVKEKTEKGNSVKETAVKEKGVTAKAIYGGPSKEKAVAGKVSAEKPVTEKKVDEKAVTAKIPAEKTVTEKKIDEKATTAKASTEKKAKEKTAKK
ncbi:hypothetical protein [Chitinophaga sp. S165]|uniref:hypothetical protein n=1 Tax=Chitinophaga sp. S165 TaxID=2135462 RepID=UPI0011B4F48E|nr:hypothetical protein [Chitinophaga sp. S165]